MKRAAIPLVLLAAIVSLAAGKSAQLPNDPRDAPDSAQVSITKSKADLNGDRKKEAVILLNALTGRSNAQVTEVILAITAEDSGQQRGDLHWVRHVAKETGKPAHGGEMMAVDLDGDGASELLLTWDRSEVPGRVDRWAEVYAVGDLTRPRRVWEGVWEIDTRRDESVAKAERQWYQRDIDYGATRRAAGRALVILTTQKVVAGKALAEYRVSRERAEVRLRH